MNVLYYLFSYPKLSESFVLNEIVELTEQGHNVAVFSIKDSGAEIKHDEYNQMDVPVHYADIPSYSDVTDLISRKTLSPRVVRRRLSELRHPRRMALQLHLGKQCSEYIEDLDFDVDIIHGHFAILTKMGAVRAAAYHRIPCTVTCHAYDLYTDERYPPVLRSVDRIVTISEYNRSYIEDKMGVSTPVNVVRAGIRPEKFEPSDGKVDRRIVTVARFSEKKGLEYAVDAVAEVAKNYPDVEYHMIGSGDREEKIRTKIDEHGLEDTVKILGNVTDERLVKELDEAEIFLLPCVVAENGDRDGIPVSLMEAMAMKTVPVSTRVSGIPELIDHRRNGMLAEPRNVTELVEMVEHILDRPEERRVMGRDAREKVEHKFNVHNETKKLVNVFKSTSQKDS